MPWEVVAEGTNIWDLESTVGELELPKGSKIMIVMDTYMSWVFNIPGIELVFKPFTPDNTKLVDVYGEDGQGIVELEVDPAWLLAVLAFIKAHWLAIIIAGFVLTALIIFITVLVKIVVTPAVPISAMVIGGGLALVGVLLIVAARKTRRRG